ncbi:MAG: dihydropteroate synthase [Pseudonocardia sp.]|nr:dihydropteroate synthase [Pseudonocardia sp.]
MADREHGMAYVPRLIKPVRTIGRRRFDFSRQVAVMAIINRTTHSFYDVGVTFELRKAVEAAEKAVADGADWLDISGVPFLNGPDVGADEELDRVIPLVEAVRECTDGVISIDTFRPDVARHAIASGADVINDTSGLRDLAMADLAAESGASLVITHSLAPPRTPLPRPSYSDVVVEVAEFLRSRAELAISRGCARSRSSPTPDMTSIRTRITPWN